jgi:membrane-bound lytic murein transglycosylase D
MPRVVAGLAGRAVQPPAVSEAAAELPPYRGHDVWRRLAQRCTLLPEARLNARIQRQLDGLLSQRGFVQGASERAGPYLHFIVERLDERAMPLEFALLPMIESAYDPLAHSAAEAAGLWQFIPSTARHFNLAQSAAYDARRDLIASSKAAMDYLQRLHAQFDGDWLLALAAYNAGEGRVAQAIELNRRRGLPTDYWHLTLPQETQDYVPRLLALSLLVRHPETYAIHFKPIANEPYFEVLAINDKVDMVRLAASAGVDAQPLLRLNPGFLAKKTLPGGLLLVPRTQKQTLVQSLSRVQSESRRPLAVHGAGRRLPGPASAPRSAMPARQGAGSGGRAGHSEMAPDHAPRVVVYASSPPP